MMLLELLLIILLSAIPACFNYFLNYCLGEPMGDNPSTKAIFSFYSIYIASSRLERVGILKDILEGFQPQIQAAPNEAARLDAKKQLEETILLAGQKYYSWEQAFGMCPFCTGFWCSLFAALVFYFTVPLFWINSAFLFTLIPIFSHSILRKLQKS